MRKKLAAAALAVGVALTTPGIANADTVNPYQKPLNVQIFEGAWDLAEELGFGEAFHNGWLFTAASASLIPHDVRNALTGGSSIVNYYGDAYEQMTRDYADMKASLIDRN